MANDERLVGVKITLCWNSVDDKPSGKVVVSNSPAQMHELGISMQKWNGGI